MHDEIEHFRTSVRKWMTEANLHLREERAERHSTWSRVGSNKSKSCRASSAVTRVKALEAKARKVELESESKIAQLDCVENAMKEAKRAQLNAEHVTAAAVSKVYEDGAKEDDERYLGSHDPDMEDEKCYQPYNPSSRFQELIVQDIPNEVIEPNSPKEVNGTLKQYANAERVQHTHKCSFNPGAPEFLPFSNGCQEHERLELQTVHHVKQPSRSRKKLPACGRKKKFLRVRRYYNINFVDPNCKSQEGFWEKWSRG